MTAVFSDMPGYCDMKNFITSIALKLVPEEGRLRNIARRTYARLYTAKDSDIIHKELTGDELAMLRDAVRIGFVGDLILLRDMVEHGRKSGEYDYRPIFTPMRGYFSECDLMTGVLEGPLPGEKLGYTTANYNDGRLLECGYPDEFLVAIKDAGINFVTVANNHLFDKDREGMERTIRQLEANSMPYVGYGRKARTLVDVKGLKIAVLAYNFTFNGKNNSFFFEAGNEDLPHLIVPKNNKYYNRCLDKVKEDFDWAKRQEPHCIMVYPHIGEQFLHTPDKNQLHWFDIFDSLGADIILGCHPHATQPLHFENNSARLYCPGNFVNNYFPHDGDASAMVEIYIDRQTGKPFAASVIPILAYGKRDGLICAEPMCELAERDDLSWHDWFRLNDAHKIVTSSMLGTPVPLHQAQKRYVIWSDNSYRRLPYDGSVCNINGAGNEAAKKIFESASTVAFIGDSITEGTKNGGYGWFEPMMASMPEKKVLRFARGMATSRTILEQFGTQIEEVKADLFCIAVGCNDISYRENAICAMTAEDYADNINTLVSLIKKNNPEAAVILIAPWWSDDASDKYCKVDLAVKHRLYQEYTLMLRELSKKRRKCLFADPNDAIWCNIRLDCQQRYLVDSIHPNAADGIRLFSKCFLNELSKIH